jgi:hypothetical protein
MEQMKTSKNETSTHYPNLYLLLSSFMALSSRCFNVLPLAEASNQRIFPNPSQHWFFVDITQRRLSEEKGKKPK